ncbi:MAG: glycosyltransferase [Methylobacter sp.]
MRRWFTRPAQGHNEPTPITSAEIESINDHTDGLVPYDENLLEQARTQWQFGDWDSLIKLERHTLQHHPDRSKLALLSAAGHMQQGDMQIARQFIRLAQDWGCSKKLISQILVSGVHNSLGRAAIVAGQRARALQHFESAIAIGTPGSETRLLVQARTSEQNAQLELPRNRIQNSFSGNKYPDIYKRILFGRRILILLWFRNLSGGGLHENVRDTVHAILAEGGVPIVVCPKSIFLEELVSENIQTFPADFENPDFPERLIKLVGKVDLIHCHPGQSRCVGLSIAKKINCPIVMTVHGKWDDRLNDYVDVIDLVVVVSPYIADQIRAKIPNIRSKLAIIPNGVDSTLFSPNQNISFKRKSQAVFVGRVDNDKIQALELMKRVWEKQASGELPRFNWVVAGDGPLLLDLIEYSRSIFLDGNNLVEFVGWLNRVSLADILKNSTLALVSGRSCMEALMAGCITVASGREGYLVINDWHSFMDASYSNFGGYGSASSSISEDKVFSFLNSVFSVVKEISYSSDEFKLIHEHLAETFNKVDTNGKLISLYAGLISGGDK